MQSESNDFWKDAQHVSTLFQVNLEIHARCDFLQKIKTYICFEEILERVINSYGG